MLLVGAASVYLLVLSGLHSLGDRALVDAVPALSVVAVMWRHRRCSGSSPAPACCCSVWRWR